MEIIAVALIASLVGPLTLGYFQAKAHRSDKHEDWRRQDEVAARLIAANTQANTKLDVIHDLVNSDMTAALQAQLVALRSQAHVMRRLFGRPDYVPAPDDFTELEHVNTQIANLKRTLAQRDNDEVG